ncbi:MAG TPA: phage head-tail connector protein [Candidatus Cloacimonas acidaminovorans]|nr:phage head-tail connector protein [Candidatus Cloacimonas acidaminovorans]
MIARLEDLKQFLNITNNTSDVLLFENLRSADEEIKRYCGRKFEVGDFTEIKNGRNRKSIMVKETPIIEVVAIYDDANRIFSPETLVSPEDYSVDKESGIITNDGLFIGGNDAIKVLYRGGYGTDIDKGETPMPKDLIQAVLEIASASFLRSQGRINAVTGELLSYNENVSKAYKLADRHLRYDYD